MPNNNPLPAAGVSDLLLRIGCAAHAAAVQVDRALRGSNRRFLRTLIVAATLTLGVSPAGAASFAYVTNAFAPSVSVIDTATNQVAATIAFPVWSVPFAAAITPDLKKVYVTSLDATSTCGTNSVFVIDTASNTIGANPIAVGCGPTGIAVTPDGTRAYVANQYDSTVSVIDAATDTVSATVTLPYGSALANVAISPDGQRAYVTAVAANSVFVIDTSSNTVLGTPIGVGTSPGGIAVSPDGRQVFVASNGALGTVSVIDAAAGTVVTTIAPFSYPAAIAFTPDGVLAYVTNGGINNGVFTVSVVDTASSTIVGNPITVDSFPNSIAITFDGKQAYVGNEGSSTVSVIDIAGNTVIATVSGMNSPRGVAARPIPPGIPVPNVVGATQAAAATAVTGAGLASGTVTQQASSTVVPGSVISQNPAAGVLVGANALVALVVSSGVAVPNVTGQTQAAATSAITVAALVIGTVTQQSSSTVSAGSVISQSPTAGTNVAGGSAVNLVVSSGPSGGGGGGGGGAVDVWTLLGLAGIGFMRRRNSSPATDGVVAGGMTGVRADHREACRCAVESADEVANNAEPESRHAGRRTRARCATCSHSIQWLRTGHENFAVKCVLAFSLLGVVLSGCAMQAAQQEVTDDCKGQGKKPFLVDVHQSGVPLITAETARIKYVCLGQNDVTHLPSRFGADAVTVSGASGVGIASVTPGSVAEKAGLKPNDFVYNFAGSLIAHVPDLVTAIDKRAPGDEAEIKIRRNGQYVSVTARF
jgi:YVTN family beta-propeller protein